jgi:hypothetical protein
VPGSRQSAHHFADPDHRHLRDIREQFDPGFLHARSTQTKQVRTSALNHCDGKSRGMHFTGWITG